MSSSIAKCGCSLADLHPELLNSWDFERNTLDPYKVTPQSHQIAWWRCCVADDHRWQAAIGNRSSQRSGCPVCAGRKTVRSNSLAITDAELAKELHPVLNGPITAWDIRRGSKAKVWWLCPRGHDYLQCPNARTNKHNLSGCPKCKRSKGEAIVAWCLKDQGVPHFEPQFRFRNCKRMVSLPFDFAVFPRGNTVGLIEYQGELHYNPRRSPDGHQKLLERQAADQIKRDFCQEKGLALLEIPYWRIKDIAILVKEFISGLEPYVP